MPAVRGFFDGGEAQNGRWPDRELQVLEMSQRCERDEGVRVYSGGMSGWGIVLC